MGNTCACLGGGDGYPMGGSRKPNRDGADYDMEDSGATPGGSYRKTAASAKYAVPTNSSTDLNKSGPQLKLELQTPVATDEEVGVFFAEGEKHENESLEKSMEQSQETRPKVKITETHVANFQAPSPNSKGNGEVLKAEDGPTLATGEASKTHVEVFDLNVPTESTSNRTGEVTTAVSQPNVVHINLKDYLVEQSSPSQETSSSTISNSPSRTSQKSGIENPNYVQTEDTIPRISVDDYVVRTSPTSNKVSVNSGSPSSGVTNDAFDISDEQKRSPKSSPDRYTVITSGSDHTEVADDKCFFFGMESLKFKRNAPLEQDRSEADRELAEIISVIDTIEDNIWLRLKPPVDDVDSPGEATEAKNNGEMYTDVLQKLKDVCSKVEDILRMKGVHSNEFDESWLNLLNMIAVNSNYDKETSTAQTYAARRLLRAADDNDEEKAREILEEYKRQQERLLRLREAERLKLTNKLGEKMASRREADGSDDRDEDVDTDQVQDQYGELLSTEVAANDTLMSSQSESDEYTSDDLSSSSDEVAVLTEADVEASMALKTTLTKGIQERITEMTSDDFQSIMSMYRKERHNIRDIRDSERSKVTTSLWEKLAERRRHVDQSIVEGVELPANTEASHETGHTKTVYASTEGASKRDAQTTVDTAETADTGTATNGSCSPLDMCVGITAEELDELTQTTLSRTFHGAVPEAVSAEAAASLLQDHFTRVRQLREQREEQARRHGDRLAEQLRAKQAVNSENGADTSVLPLPGEIPSKDEASLEDECLNNLKRRETVSQDELASILEKYKEDQKSLSDQRSHQMAIHNERLREKLVASRNDAVVPRPESKQETELQAMDAAFYHALVAKRHEGDLTPAQVSQLIDEHLDLVDEFKREVRQQINQRRRERRAKASSADVTALVEEDRQNREQLKRLRRQEKERMDDKLGAKLKQKKQMHENSDIPPKKPERKIRSSIRDDSWI